MMAYSRPRRHGEIVLREKEQEKELVEGARNGDLLEVERLLDANVSPNAVEYNRSLFYASKNYITPLQIASLAGHWQCVQVLLRFGADYNAKDRFDVTALHMAAEMGNLKCVELLLEFGADCNVGTKYSKQGSYTAVPHPGGTTPLHLAATQNHVACVKQLIWYGADYNAVDEQGRTSLYIAAQKAFSRCVHAHLDNAVRRDILSLPVAEEGNTPLHECVRSKMLSCVQALLKHGSDVNHKNVSGYSPLHLALRATEKFSMDIVNELVTKGYNTDVNSCDAEGFTPLHYVCFADYLMQERRSKVAALLIAYGANYNIQNKQQEPLLVWELLSANTDHLILQAIMESMACLPTLEELGLKWSSIRVLLNSSKQKYQNSKWGWYQLISKQPRTLQHCCRCEIRSALGTKRLGLVGVLSLPLPLKGFLMLGVEDLCSSPMPSTHKENNPDLMKMIWRCPEVSNDA